MAMAQDPETAAYDGMPRSAIATGPRRLRAGPGRDAGAAARLRAPRLRPPAEPRARRGARRRPTAAAGAAPAARAQRPRLLDYKANTHAAAHGAPHGRHPDRAHGGLPAAPPARPRSRSRPSSASCSSASPTSSATRRPSRRCAEGAAPAVADRTARRAACASGCPGCSTGEEAYSIAMLLQEQADDARRNVPVQIFATDIDAEAIERARAGVYPDEHQRRRLARAAGALLRPRTAAPTASARRCATAWSSPSRTSPRTRPSRARPDQLPQPAHLPGRRSAEDGSCRCSTTRSTPDGFLLLGSSETVGDAADLFTPVDKKWKLYQRRGTITPRQQLLASPCRCARARRPACRRQREPPLRVRVRDLAERMLLREARPGLRGRSTPRATCSTSTAAPAGTWSLPPGSPAAALQDGPRGAAAGAHHRACAGSWPRRRRCATSSCASSTNGAASARQPDHRADDAGRTPSRACCWSLFEDVARRRERRGRGRRASPSPTDEQRIADLDRELTAKEEYLRPPSRSWRPPTRSSSRPTRSCSPPTRSCSPPTRSWRPRREELQSVNEELVTVNSELQQKIEELSRANNDMNNLLAGTGIGTLFVDQQLRIQRFTPAVTAIINLIPTDVGRPLSDITPRLAGRRRPGGRREHGARHAGAPSRRRSRTQPGAPTRCACSPTAPSTT